MEYTVIRSDRKTLSLQVRPKGLIVRAPRRVSEAQIAEFVKRHRRWIETHLARVQDAEAEALPPLSMKEIDALADRAMEVIPARVRYYAEKLGVTYGKITIRNQRTRWGSCSSGGNLNFNCLLMLTPPEVIDSVVVHELCHRLQMNHSPAFYAEVLRVYPEYHKWHGWLREHGSAILGRMRAEE